MRRLIEDIKKKHRLERESPVYMLIEGLPEWRLRWYLVKRFVVWTFKCLLPEGSAPQLWCRDWLQWSWWREFFNGLNRKVAAREDRHENAI